MTRDTTGRAWRFPLGEAARPMRAPLLQEQADAGRVCIVVARRRDLTRPGHIAAVVPETAQHRARRTGTTVTAPLRCQAGARNFSYDRPVWWTRERFESFGYWSA